MDTQLEERLRRDLFDVTREVEAPVGFAHEALRSGRRLRRRRTSLLLAAGAIAVVAGVLLVPAMESDEPVASDPVSQGPTPQLEWARSLPQGKAPGLPIWTDQGLRDGDTVVSVPDEVDRSRLAQRVDGGWLVLLHTDPPELAPAVLSPAGNLRGLAPDPDDERGGNSLVSVSPDGSRAAYGNRVVELATGDLTELSLKPLSISGWSDEGLIYEATAAGGGSGTEWLLRDDGSRVELGAPGSEVRSYGNGTAAGFALTFDVSDLNDVCTTIHSVGWSGWDEGGTHCMGRRLATARDLSPDGRWLLTDDFPEIWDVVDGEWITLDTPTSLLQDGTALSLDSAGWESADTLLIPVVDKAAEGPQTVQIVRCRASSSSRTCERAGEEMQLSVDYNTAGGPSPLLVFGGY